MSDMYNRSLDLQIFIVDLFETIPRLHLHYYNLTEKGKTFYWSLECNHAFRTLKKCLIYTYTHKRIG